MGRYFASKGGQSGENAEGCITKITAEEENVSQGIGGGEKVGIGRKLVELRKSTGMNRRQFSDYFGIPYRTVQDWEFGNRHMPEYLFRLMVYRIEMEKSQGKLA